MPDYKINTGGCACGVIRYEFKGEPAAAITCHCRDCQPLVVLDMLPVCSFGKTHSVIYPENPSTTRRFQSAEKPCSAGSV